MIPWFQEDEGAAMESQLVDQIVTAIRTNTLDKKSTINLSDYYNTVEEYGVNLHGWKTVDYGDGNKFDISLKINTLLSDTSKNSLSISTYSEREFNRNYGHIDGLCTTFDFKYKNRSITGLEVAVPVAQKEKFKDYLFAALIEKISVSADSALACSDEWKEGVNYTCNVAVRTYLYLFKDKESVLFPKTGSGLTSVNDTGDKYIKGEIDENGMADDIYKDLEIDNEHSSYFEKIEKGPNSTWKTFFDDIQTSVNFGEVIIGVIHSDDRPNTSHGHIVAIMPLSLNSVDRAIINIGGVFYKPIALEAGSANKEIVPIKSNAEQLVKYEWYKYIKR